MKKQETLKEVAEKHANLYYDKNSELSSVITESIEWSNRNHNFIEGAKWMLEKLQDFDTWKEWKDITFKSE